MSRSGLRSPSPRRAGGGRATAGIVVAATLTAAGLAHGRRAHAQLLPGAAPNFGAVVLEPDFAPDPQSVAVVAGGPIDAHEVAGGDCKGFVSAEPDVVLDVREPLAWLRIYVTSPADTTLVIQREDGSFLCSDDAFGLAPAIDTAVAPGRYAIRIGSYRPDTPARANLWFTHTPEHHP